eukprot:501117_1
MNIIQIFKGQEIQGVPVAAETDAVGCASIYLLIMCVSLYGIGLIVFQSTSLHYYQSLNQTDFFGVNTLLQLIRWSSIQLYSLNRIIRPANRCDPLRTIFDLDVTEICLDSLDSAALFQILFTNDLHKVEYINLTLLTKITMLMWVTSVVVRIALLYTVIWKLMLPHKLVRKQLNTMIF